MDLCEIPRLHWLFKWGRLTSTCQSRYLLKRRRNSALLTCQARTWLKRRRTGASYCQGVVESMRLKGVPASLGFCTCRYYHPLNTWSTVLPSPPWILGRQCCVLPWILGPRDTLARIHQFLQLKRRGAGGWGLLLISFNTDEEIESKLAFKQRQSLILIILNT